MNLEETAYWIDQLIPGELTFRRVDGLHVALADVGGGQRLACTVDFGGVDTGLVDAEGVEVRSELLAVARVSEDEATATVAAAAQLLADARGIIPAQPGTMLPGLAERAGLTGHGEISVAHGLLVAPYLWGGDVPRMTEEGRLTVMLQLVMLTGDEHAYAVAHGVAALQEKLGAEQVDLLDWRR